MSDNDDILNSDMSGLSLDATEPRLYDEPEGVNSEQLNVVTVESTLNATNREETQQTRHSDVFASPSRPTSNSSTSSTPSNVQTPGQQTRRNRDESRKINWWFHLITTELEILIALLIKMLSYDIKQITNNFRRKT